MAWTQFVVAGRGEFPWDMLRYDRCWPADTASAMALRTPIGMDTTRFVELVCCENPNRWEPTQARWHSFGWSCGAQGTPLWDEHIARKRAIGAGGVS